MSTIWFDATTVFRWRRPAVGVIRVQNECFRYFASLSSEPVRFCRFDLKAGAFFELSVDEIEDAIRAQSVISNASPTPRAAKRVADTTSKVIEQMPQLLRDPMKELSRKSTPLLRTTLHNIRQARARVETMSEELGLKLKPDPNGSTRAPPIAFERGDVLVSTGLDWDEKDMSLQYRLKRDHGLRQLLFCHDVLPVKLPHLCVPEVAAGFSRYFVNLAWCADRVLCNSKSTERDLVELLRELGAPVPPTQVVRLGSNLPSSSDGAAGDAVDALAGQDYLLFVSTIERRKNHEVLYRALTLLADQGRENLPKLVFVGMSGWGVHDLVNDMKHDPRVHDRLVMLNHVTDAQLAHLYRHARFTLYPSLYEGWGLPLAESLAYGKFCLASNTSSLPEVGGDLVEYIHPWEPAKWAERIAHYIDAPAEVAQREKEIRERYRAPTWEDTGRAMFTAAKELLARPSPAASTPAA
ncbi:MAG: glycosyltransferase family 1 protein [Myxococcaceae bacterium]